MATTSTMFNAESRILKAEDQINEHEETVSKIVNDYQIQLKEDSVIRKDLERVFIASVEEFHVVERDGHHIKCLLVKLPYKSFEPYTRIRSAFVGHLERKLNCMVFVVGMRKILSKRVKTPGVKKRPISRTLTHVFNCLLDDVCLPSQIVGKQIRVHTDGTQTMKVFLDPLDKEKVEDRLDAMSEAYKKLTTRKVKFFFAKPTKFQKQLAEFKKKQQNKA
uniref:40S ribosomal protein S7 n=2 Tax=Euplotes crassus TaxID=5936 RepID=A0A7S3P341_EUPCR|mmetsp:Transcript_9901/g.9771  ORF Transcript_9901/g.9771 Transcript_9901/m.9771 type:complete len:220 (+) Transcript_9901:2-661(+)